MVCKYVPQIVEFVNGGVRYPNMDWNVVAVVSSDRANLWD